MTQAGHVRLERRRWRVFYRVTEPGKPRRLVSRTLGTVHELPTRAAARRAADRLLTKSCAAQDLHPGTVMTWPEWCKVYTERHLVLLSRGSQSTRRSIIKHLAHAVSLADLAVHEIDELAVQTFVVDTHRAGAAASTTRARFALLRRMLRAARDAGLAATPPCSARIQFPRDQVVHASIKAKAFTPAEVAAILPVPKRNWQESGQHADHPCGQHVDRMLQTACACAYFAGLRCGEVLGLAWPAIDLDTGRLEVRQQVLGGEVRPLKCKSSHATLTMPAPLRDRLRAYSTGWTPNPLQLLFATEDGQPLHAQALRHALYELLDSLKIPRRGMHGFRHAAALAMARAGTNPESMRRAMRHASLRTTAIYLSATSEDVAAALSATATVTQTLHHDTHPAAELPMNPATDVDPRGNK